MNRAAILIGVNRALGLPMLNDAVQGAKRMQEWVLTQGFAPNHAMLITDEQDPVTTSVIQDAVESILNPMAGIEQLLIYFAGHGLNINYGEFWLLSKGLERAMESVDVARSVILARYSSVPHVIFISDACRTAAAGVQQQLITGSPIFPISINRGIEKAVDQFFACTLGNPALEIQYQNTETADSFKALYTEALLAVFRGDEPAIIENANDGHVPEGVIRPWPLKRALSERVSRLIIEHNLYTRAFQTPDARISSDPVSSWIARLALPSYKEISSNSGPTNINASRPRSFGQKDLNQQITQSLPEWVDMILNRLLAGCRVRNDSKLHPIRNEISIQAFDRCTYFNPQYPEIRCGIKLHGEKAVKVICPDVPFEWVVEGESLRAFPQSTETRNQALVILSDGSGVLVPILPEFIAELTFDNGRWVGLGYDTANTSLLHKSNRARRTECRYLREFVAAAVERGVFQPNRSTITALTYHLLKTPIPDPVLFLYLAYAIDDIGMGRQLRDLIAELNIKGTPSLFDVELLAWTPGEKPEKWGALSSGMPLLARGWPILAAHDWARSKQLNTFSQMRQPGLWSHFTPEAISIFLQQLSHQR